MNVMEVHDLHFAYTDHKILNGVHLEVKAGEIICLFGPNGCGKTTLLECMLGLIKSQSGSITVCGRNIKNMKKKVISQHISFVPQFQESSFGYSVLDMILMGRTPRISIFGGPDAADMEIAESALYEVGLEPLRDRNYNSLSGGEAQLVKLARAIAQDTKILVLDEPTAHLDFRNELKVLKQVSRMAKRGDRCIIMATHFPNHAYLLENEGNTVHVAMMRNGKIAAFGNTNAVLDAPHMKNIFGIESIVSKNILPNGNIVKYMMPINLLEQEETR